MKQPPATAPSLPGSTSATMSAALPCPRVSPARDRWSSRLNGGSYNTPMSRRSDRPAAPFTAPERDLLRRELCRHFGQDPPIADGIFLRTWRSGERRNQPKIPPAVQTMLERGLVELRSTREDRAPSSPKRAWRRCGSSCSIAAPWIRSVSRICASSSASIHDRDTGGLVGCAALGPCSPTPAVDETVQSTRGSSGN